MSYQSQERKCVLNSLINNEILIRKFIFSDRRVGEKFNKEKLLLNVDKNVIDWNLIRDFRGRE